MLMTPKKRETIRKLMNSPELRAERKALAVRRLLAIFEKPARLRYARRPGPTGDVRDYQFENSPEITQDIAIATGYRFKAGYLRVGGLSDPDGVIVAAIADRLSAALYGSPGGVTAVQRQ